MLILWIRPIHLFVTTKKSGWVRCYCHVQSGFCLKIWWTINPWAFCSICMLDLHVVALVLPSTCHYTAASSMVVVRSRPRPCRRSPPWLARCARRRLALSTWSTTPPLQKKHGQQPRGIRRWLYVERLTVGTHQGHCISQARASLLQAKKYFLLIVWQLGSTPLSM